MLDAATVARIDEIGRDRTSGAAELALRVAKVLSAIAPEDLPAVVEALLQAQPAMASIGNVVQAAFAGRLDGYVVRLRRSGAIIARKAAESLRDKVVLTHSFSTTVVGAIQAGRPRHVLCTESLPGGEGRRTAALLNGETIPDAAVYSALSRVDLVLVGADAVTPEAVVNKIGTAPVALAAREQGRPAWVLCGVDKYVSSAWRPQFGDLFEATPRAWFTGIIDDSE